MKILLLNPPSEKFVIRDYYCSHTAKSNYYWGPVDLFVLSGILSKKHEVKVSDAIVGGLHHISQLSDFLLFHPDIIFMLVSDITKEDDKKTTDYIKTIFPDTKIYAIGDSAYFNPEEFLEDNQKIDGVLFDFTSKYILDFLEGKPKYDLAYRDKEEIIILPLSPEKDYDYPTPLFELFPLERYGMPFSRHKKVATVLMNYGCPYSCKFCSSGKLPFKKRHVESLFDDFKRLRKLNIKEAYIRDFTFSADKQAVHKFCSLLIWNSINIEWSCDARIDNMDEEMLQLMKKAGCYCIFYGVESADQDVLDKSHKNFKIENVKEIFKLTNKCGINTLASFIIGLPGDTKESICNTIKLSKKLKCDYASFNMFVPRYGTDFREEYGPGAVDSSKDVTATGVLSEKELIKLHKKAIRSFYLRPNYILKRLFKIKTFCELKRMIQNFRGLL